MCLDWTNTELALLQKYHRSTLQLSRNLKDMVMVLQRLVIYSRLPDVTIQKTYIYIHIFQTNNIHPNFSPLVLHPHWTWQTMTNPTRAHLRAALHDLCPADETAWPCETQLPVAKAPQPGTSVKKTGLKSETSDLIQMNIYDIWTSMNIYEHLWTSMNIYERTSMNIYEHLRTSMNIKNNLTSMRPHIFWDLDEYSDHSCVATHQRWRIRLKLPFLALHWMLERKTLSVQRLVALLRSRPHEKY